MEALILSLEELHHELSLWLIVKCVFREEYNYGIIKYLHEDPSSKKIVMTVFLITRRWILKLYLVKCKRSRWFCMIFMSRECFWVKPFKLLLLLRNFTLQWLISRTTLSTNKRRRTSKILLLDFELKKTTKILRKESSIM